ncbi:unnamed protein product [Clavelina lepadiformis]|uniref:Uncharacterized protein n=1 Tax=Clavelina lepadiformis TaxID=159417 RepID=A0ABP0FCF3_CLALP
MTQTSSSLESLGSAAARLRFLASDRDEFKSAISHDEIAAPGVILGPRFLDAVCLGEIYSSSIVATAFQKQTKKNIFQTKKRQTNHSRNVRIKHFGVHFESTLHKDSLTYKQSCKLPCSIYAKHYAYSLFGRGYFPFYTSQSASNYAHFSTRVVSDICFVVIPNILGFNSINYIKQIVKKKNCKKL